MTDGPDDPGHARDRPEGVGSVGEEAAKLFGALSDWARTENLTDNLAGNLTDHLTSAMGAANEHIATGGEDCRYCPVCQMISVVRSTSPEVRAHLTSAAGSFLQAASSLLATHVPPERARGPVEHIDLSDDTGDWDSDQTPGDER